MDLSFLFTPLSPNPVDANQAQVTLRGALAPVHIAREWIPPATAAEWLLDNSLVILAERLRTALDAERYQQAWRMLNAQALADPRVQTVLNKWSARRQAQLGLRSNQQQIIVVGQEAKLQKNIRNMTTAAQKSLNEQFPLMGWPTWSGPIVVVTDGSTVGQLTPSLDYLARPALPMLRLDCTQPSSQWREQIAARLTQIIIGNIDPENRLPAWFAPAMINVATARARGEGPSPRAMHSIRQKHGPDGLTKTLLIAPINQDIAQAIGAFLCHSHRVQHLPALIELLINQVDSLSALDIAYGISVEDLIQHR